MEKQTPPEQPEPIEKDKVTEGKQQAERTHDLPAIERKQAAVSTKTQSIHAGQLAMNSGKEVKSAQKSGEMNILAAQVETGEEKQTLAEPESMRPMPEGDDYLEMTIPNEKRVKENYIKISRRGEILGDSAEHWSCVEDPKTGLVWEVKSTDGGLHHNRHLYSWYEPGMSRGLIGVADTGRCEGGINCDTSAFVLAVNKEKYCGFSDWRLPTRDELFTIVSMADTTSSVAIDMAYFPQTLPSWYWTSSTNENYPNYAWYVLFRNGIALSDNKARSKHIRLVRSDSPAG